MPKNSRLPYFAQGVLTCTAHTSSESPNGTKSEPVISRESESAGRRGIVTLDRGVSALCGATRGRESCHRGHIAHGAALTLPSNHRLMVISNLCSYLLVSPSIPPSFSPSIYYYYYYYKCRSEGVTGQSRRTRRRKPTPRSKNRSHRATNQNDPSVFIGPKKTMLKGRISPITSCPSTDQMAAKRGGVPILLVSTSS
jgi:hypothetical protein